MIILRYNDLFIKFEFQSITNLLHNLISKLAICAADAAASIGLLEIVLVQLRFIHIFFKD